ncbi:hypothetical protein M409DRAFT_60606 [Zasmidium cellare ATCC 36951]|uniref:Uncharacterized protein n=1 Tax=Zasmidium cellare ATCC 36951 TaxID=1080233 RepID=A0A6A6C097_ZASCE|nr:uncharacterized protein M409DRAFT_60606 [Zasmidium cellare ATCC 36951]KAF2159678.1 hypothetical protein M409DRAFT_60606 [Zasmidium cellare ATCC 36951]
MSSSASSFRAPPVCAAAVPGVLDVHAAESSAARTRQDVDARLVRHRLALAVVRKMIFKRVANEELNDPRRQRREVAVRCAKGASATGAATRSVGSGSRLQIQSLRRPFGFLLEQQHAPNHTQHPPPDSLPLR